MSFFIKEIRFVKDHKKFFMSFFISLCVFFNSVQAAESGWPSITVSKDKTPISYEVYGHGGPVLIFIHGWSCDSRYWRKQISPFSKNHTVVLLDLAGHGHSGNQRSRYTTRAFGEDVRAVAEAFKEENLILIGHSMGATVAVEAARLMPDRVLGIIGVDDFEDVEYELSQEGMDAMVDPLREDFVSACRNFAADMMISTTDSALKEWILDDMSAAPQSVAIGSMTEMLERFVAGEVPKVFEEIEVPIITVHGDLWPINYQANRRHMKSFEAIVLNDAGHFLMMNQPDRFNQALRKAIDMLLNSQ